MDNIEKYIVNYKIIVRDAIKQLDEGGIGFCVSVDDDDNVIGVISDGDFRRAVLSNVKLDEPVDRIINRKFKYANKDYKKRELEEIFSGTALQHIPIIDNGKLLDIITKEYFYGVKRKKRKELLNNPVVIMAGGKGTRLDPFTRILPKPLIPLGEDPIIKVIMDEFGSYGIKDFHITLNEKGKMIKAYFHNHDMEYNLNFIEEKKPMGTAGALIFLKGKLKDSFFVSNCDILIKSDYGDILKFHQQRKNALTLVGSMQHYKIPYGVCEIDNGGELINIREKPEYDFLSNTGLYLLEPDVLALIPDDTYFDMTNLIKKVKSRGLKVGLFPISEKSWVDVGQWEEYRKVIDKY